MSPWYRQLRLVRPRDVSAPIRSSPRCWPSSPVLAAGQPMPAHERLRTPLGQARAAARAVGALLAAAFGAVGRGLRLAATACAIADPLAGRPAARRGPGLGRHRGAGPGHQPRTGRGCPT